MSTPQGTPDEMTQRFVEYVMMTAQQAAMYLGRMANPATGKPEPNLEVARILIDQLEMIREKTKGNLSREESELLGGILSDLQLAFVEAAKGAPASPVSSSASPEAAPPEIHSVEGESAAPSEGPPADPDSKKRFTKSYG